MKIVASSPFTLMKLKTKEIRVIGHRTFMVIDYDGKNYKIMDRDQLLKEPYIKKLRIT